MVLLINMGFLILNNLYHFRKLIIRLFYQISFVMTIVDK